MEARIEAFLKRGHRVAADYAQVMAETDSEIARSFVESGAERAELFRIINYDQVNCNECGRAASLHCIRCGTKYCSVSCQRIAWTHHHRTVCLSTPHAWSEWIQRNLHSLTATSQWIHEFECAKTTKEAEKLLEVIDRDMHGFDEAFDPIEDKYKRLYESPVARALQMSACRVGRTFVPLLARFVHLRCKSDEKTHRTFLETLYHDSFISRSRGHFEDGQSNIVLTEPCYSWHEPVLVMSTKNFVLHEAILLRSYEHPSAPTVYLFSISECAPPPERSWVGGESFERSVEQMHAKVFSQITDCVNQLILDHTFAVVCMNKNAFIVQAFQGHYTYDAWLAFDRRLELCPLLQPTGSPRYRLLDRIDMRRVLPRPVLFDVLAFCLDQLAGEKFTPGQRANAYSALTGLVVPPIPYHFLVRIVRANIASLL